MLFHLNRQLFKNSHWIASSLTLACSNKVEDTALSKPQAMVNLFKLGDLVNLQLKIKHN